MTASTWPDRLPNKNAFGPINVFLLFWRFVNKKTLEKLTRILTLLRKTNNWNYALLKHLAFDDSRCIVIYCTCRRTGTQNVSRICGGSHGQILASSLLSTDIRTMKIYSTWATSLQFTVLYAYKCCTYPKSDDVGSSCCFTLVSDVIRVIRNFRSKMGYHQSPNW